ncbi:hypothetical protein RCLKYE_97 [Rhodobacter phage RcLkye]|nr:hypothetical protein RCLKYE_97 [Rhodobacter phage RcLkye]
MARLSRCPAMPFPCIETRPATGKPPRQAARATAWNAPKSADLPRVIVNS